MQDLVVHKKNGYWWPACRSGYVYHPFKTPAGNDIYFFEKHEAENWLKKNAVGYEEKPESMLEEAIKFKSLNEN